MGNFSKQQEEKKEARSWDKTVNLKFAANPFARTDLFVTRA